MAGLSVFWNAPKKKNGHEFVFGSITERMMFPVHTIPTRMGLEQGIRGQPNRGPGCYSQHPNTMFLQAIDDRLKNKRGCGFGVQDSRRILFNTQAGPGPADHQTLMDPSKMTLKKAFMLPFNQACSRFAQSSDHLEHLGPGSHDHGMAKSRHVLCHESFGGPRTLKGPVPVKCTLGIPDKCRYCGVDLIGDYYANKSATLCRTCYSRLSSTSGCLLPATRAPLPPISTDQSKKASLETTPTSTENQLKEVEEEEKGNVNENVSETTRKESPANKFISLKNMRKIRDCSSIHRHQFPGTVPKTIIMSDADQKKRARREAYLQLYF